MSSVSPESSPSAASPITDLFVSMRPTLSYVLLALGLGAFVFGGIYTAKVVESVRAASTEASDKKPDTLENPLDPMPPLPKDEGGLGKPEHLLAAIGGFMFAVIFGGVGLNLLLALPPYTEAESRREARKTILLAGCLAGLALLVLGLSFFILYFGILSTWLGGDKDKPAPEGTWKLLAAILGMLFGAGLAFLSAQPARLDERENPNTRRLIYGMNFALSTLLLLMLLLVGNIVVSLKVPNKLDTTAAGINSITLSEATKDYLIGLTNPVTIYSTLEADDPISLDARRLLEAVREQNPGLITTKTLSKTLGKAQIEELRATYPQADLSEDGLLVTVGTDKTQYAYLRGSDLGDMTGDPRSGGGQRTFVGEQKLMKELLFLTQNKTKPVIYFTTGHGELEVLANPDPMAPPAGPGRTAAKLRSTLEKGYAELRPLPFPITDPKVPDDCAVLVIADPRAAFNSAETTAIRTYLDKPNAAGKTGRLIVMSSPTATADKQAVVDLGLDDVLMPYGLGLANNYLLNQPVQSFTYADTLAVVRRLRGKDNAIAKEFADGDTAFGFPNAREVRMNEGPPRPGLTVDPLMTSSPGRITWLEESAQDSPARAFKELLENRDLQIRKRAEQGGRRLVAVIVSEGERGKIAVFGSGAAFADPVGRNPAYNPENSAQLFAVTLNWLREQPQVANITAKTYGTYTLEKDVDQLRLVLLPFLVMTLTVLAFGIGVWIVRRK